MEALRVERVSDPDRAPVRALRLRALLDAPEGLGTTHAEDEGRPAENWQRCLVDPASDRFLVILGHEDVVLGVSDMNTAAVALHTEKGFAPTGRSGPRPLSHEHFLVHEMDYRFRK